MVEFAGSGDPARSMALLWELQDAPTRGPKASLSVATVVAAAIRLADDEGLEAVSMRRVADALGKSTMSLYTYVPAKAELLDLMLDTVLGELPTTYDTGDGWRAAVEVCARDQWDFYERHPWVVRVSGSRAALGPHEFDVYETQLALFDGLGLDGMEMTRMVGVVASFVRGTAKAVADARAVEHATGVSDDDWWNARAPLLDQLSGVRWEERYPTLTRLDAEHAFHQYDRPEEGATYTVQEALDHFELGLRLLLDGIERYVAVRSDG